MIASTALPGRKKRKKPQMSSNIIELKCKKKMVFKKKLNCAGFELLYS
jgi:hypothetical protein